MLLRLNITYIFFKSVDKYDGNLIILRISISSQVILFVALEDTFICT